MPTGQKYIIADSVGEFSNSATTNSKLAASIQIDNENIGIMLWEYGSNLVKGTFDYEDYSITILDTLGTKHYFTGTMYKSGTRVYFNDNDRNKIINILNQEGEIKIHLQSSKYSISTYLFSIETGNFKSAFQELR